MRARAPEQQTVCARYEELRMAALGGGLSVHARSGLAVFLRRGMWGWVQVAGDPSVPAQSTTTASARTIADRADQAVIHIFAAMAMSSIDRRSHERIQQGPVAPPRA